MSLTHFTTPVFLGRMAIGNLKKLEFDRQVTLWNYGMALASVWALGGVAFDKKLGRPLRAAAGVAAAGLALELINARAKRLAARAPLLKSRDKSWGKTQNSRGSQGLVFEVVETIEI